MTDQDDIETKQAKVIKAKLRSEKGKASEKACSWLEQEPLFLDTETTGLDDSAQIIEIAIFDASGQELLCKRLKPTVEINQRAQDVHGISAADLKDCPNWPEIAEEVQRILAGRSVIIFNAGYDTRLLKQTAAAYDDSAEWLSSCTFLCAMKLAANMYGATNQYGTISLINACIEAGVSWKGEAHSALADTQATLDLVKAIAQFNLDVQKQIEQI
ncbi:3'-5' exonuclease [Thiopseudomonas alkaliphila]|uniref:3'-5' exonuclease n=1 Tax=Thiopseudomonas alkaliphila TaxID=1697053 RepID=UPI0025767F3E|nr:3'-5' exonuclease [Thiopseudomonas alkaliphila]MDM1717324.1 3'-5' exonuclease [Thiopseudomonas alkaliphila]